MYPTGGSGDLYVIIKEADGSEQNFIVPYASLPILQREGRLKYALTAGQYRSWDRRVDKTPFGQMTGILGAGGGFTLYGGFQESAKYQSIAGGRKKPRRYRRALQRCDAGMVASSGGEETGRTIVAHTLQQKYARHRHNFAIAGYRYSTGGYYAMQETLDSWGIPAR